MRDCFDAAVQGSVRVLLAAVCVCVSAEPIFAQALTFTTFAGPAGGPGAIDAAGAAARFHFGSQAVAGTGSRLAIDGSGNLYVADTVNSTIRKIDPAGTVTTLAGLAGALGATDGSGGAARFGFPQGVAVDVSGNVYVSDTGKNTIRKITATGLVTTFAGSGTAGSDDGTGRAATFNVPVGLAIDASGNIYVADAGNNEIRRITPAGVVTTFAGVTMAGAADGSGSAARFSSPTGIAINASGTLYVADTGNFTLRAIAPDGTVSTLAGVALVGGTSDGTGSSARFEGPGAVAVDASGTIYVADTGTHTIRRVTPQGAVTTIAGVGRKAGWADGSPGLFNAPDGLAVDSAGNVFVGDRMNNVVRKIVPNLSVTTWAGAPAPFGNVDGTGTAADFREPVGIAVDDSGNVYVADTTNSTIRKITAAGDVSTLAGNPLATGNVNGTGSSAWFTRPQGVAADGSGNVYVADTDDQTIRKIAPGGVVTNFAGTPLSLGDADGTGTNAQFNFPHGLATDAAGDVYVADTDNNLIRKITPAGVVSTIAGVSGPAGFADGTSGAALFASPTGVAVDSGGNIYVADKGNHRIRRISTAGNVGTVAGNGTPGYVDGPASSAEFNSPQSIAVDSLGNVYVADEPGEGPPVGFSTSNLFGNQSIRKITPAGVVTTIGGAPQLTGSEDGTGSVARFNTPAGVAVDTTGNLFVTDRFNEKIRVGRAALPDAATIDAPSGKPGVLRQLDVTPQSATSWQWSVIRRPSASTAQLSSTAVRNPTFTPDVADVFVFRLLASNATNSSVTTVTLNAGGIKGDADGDGQITASDCFYLINGLFGGGPPPPASADANGDGQVTVADLFYLINYLFCGGPAPR